MDFEGDLYDQEGQIRRRWLQTATFLYHDAISEMVRGQSQTGNYTHVSD